MNFRHATIHDTGALVNLLNQLGYKLDTSQMKARIHAYSKNGYEILVAEENDQVIGFIAHLCYEQFVTPQTCCRIDALVVHEGYRGKGIGKQLVAAVEEFALRSNANMIELITANHRRATGTHAFYESLGYKGDGKGGFTYFLKGLQ